MNNDRILATLDVLERLHRLPDAAALTTSEAAIFLRCSVSALESMRAKGTGPIYMQGGAIGAVGSNQKCLYAKSDLLAWQQKQKVSSTVQAAVRKGQLFVSVFDLAEREAFWIDGAGAIMGMVEAAPADVAIGRLGAYEIAWLAPLEAASQRWTELAGHESFARAVMAPLHHAIDGVAAGVEATELSAASRG